MPHKALHTLPSWVADYSLCFRSSRLRTVHGATNRGAYNADNGNRWQISSTSVDQPELEVQGLLFDTGARLTDELKPPIAFRLGPIVPLVASIGSAQRSCAPT
jgi:hypothetical protein